MKILVLGAGQMGSAAAFDLARSREITAVGLADSRAPALHQCLQNISSSKLRAHRLEIEDMNSVAKLFSKYDGVISAVPYRFNARLAKIAVQTYVHFCDLGGNDQIVAQEFLLHRRARERRVRLIPDCGLAPGMTSLLVADGLKQLDRVDTVQIRVGGLPQRPRPPLNYQLVFSVEGLINEYVEPARILENGKLRYVESLTGIESISFRGFPPLEAFHTSGGASTLPLSLRGKIRELNYKTIRYAGHAEKFRTMIRLGLASSEPVHLERQTIVPRALLGTLLEKNLPAGEPDCVLVRVTLEGFEGKRRKRRVYEIIDRYDPRTKLTAMMRTTAFPASIIVQMLVRGDVRPFGVLRQEQVVPPERFLQALRMRGIKIQVTDESD